MFLIGGSDWEGVVGVSKGVKDTNVKEGTLVCCSTRSRLQQRSAWHSHFDLLSIASTAHLTEVAIVVQWKHRSRPVRAKRLYDFIGHCVEG